MAQPRVSEYYTGKCIFITGATGFMGKVLVEKLLRSCPGIRKIYILIRSKKDKTGKRRWKEITNNELFDTLKSKRPGIFDSDVVEVVEGDVSAKRLGLSDENYKMLQERVSIVFHVAATVNFNEPLHQAVFINVRGTREVVELVLGMKNIEAFIHMSTAYCHVDRDTKSEEIFYPPAADWRLTLKIAEELNPRDITFIQSKIIGKFPNTYAFTKNLGEEIIREYMDQIPVVVLRPSVVLPKYQEPHRGWIETLSGPLALGVFGSTGALRVWHAAGDCFLDYIPVDCAIDGMIVAAWSKATSSFIDEENPVYHQTGKNNIISHFEMLNVCKKCIEFRPPKFVLWNMQPTETMLVGNDLKYYLKAIYYHILPSIALDKLLKMFGQKPMLSRVHRKIRFANLFLGYFANSKFEFSNEKYVKLSKQLKPEDEDEFCLDYNIKMNYYSYFESFWIVLKKLFLKDTEDNLQAYRRRRKLLNILDHISTFSIRGILILVAYNYISQKNLLDCLTYSTEERL